jgi:hypothetical protein
MSSELTIIIPLLQQNSRLSSELKELSLALIKFSINAEVILITHKKEFHLDFEDYRAISTPTSLKLRAVTTKEESAKLGRLLRIATSISDSRFVLYFIPEGKFDVQFIPKALSLLRTGSSLVLANRIHIENLDKHAARSLFFKQNILRSVFLLAGAKNLPKDFTNSSRMFDKYVLDALAISGNNWDMLAEQSIKCILANAKVELIDVSVKDFKTENDFQVSFLEAALGILRLLPRTLLHKRIIPWF